MHALGVFLFVVFALAIGATPAQAGTSARVDARKVEPSLFPQLVEVIEQEMGEGGRYEYVSESERAAVRRNLATMANLLDGRRVLDELNEDQLVQLMNAQERANAILGNRDSERLVCERRKTIGTHRRDVHCETYGQRMARIQGTHKTARRWLEIPCASSTASELSRVRVSAGHCGPTAFRD